MKISQVKVKQKAAESRILCSQPKILLIQTYEQTLSKKYQNTMNIRHNIKPMKIFVKAILMRFRKQSQ